LALVGLTILLYNYATWSPFGLPFGFSSPIGFYAFEDGIKVLGMIFGLLTFTSFLPRGFG